MTTVIIDAPHFDLAVTESLDYRGIPRYIIRYGLETKKRDTLLDAIKEFQDCLVHATSSLYPAETVADSQPTVEVPFGLPVGYTMDRYADDDWVFFDAEGMDDGGYSNEESARQAAWDHYRSRLTADPGRVPAGYSLLLGGNGEWGVRDPQGRWIQEGASDKETACQIALAHYYRSQTTA